MGSNMTSYPSNIWTINEMITHAIEDPATWKPDSIPYITEDAKDITKLDTDVFFNIVKEMSNVLVTETNKLSANETKDAGLDQRYRVYSDSWLSCMLSVIESDREYKSTSAKRYAVNYLISAFFKIISGLNVVDISYRVLTLRDRINGGNPICSKVLYPGMSEFDMYGAGFAVNIASGLAKCYKGIHNMQNPEDIAYPTDPWNLGQCQWYYDYLMDLYRTLAGNIHKFVTDPDMVIPLQVKDNCDEVFNTRHPIYIDVQYLIGKDIAY